MKRLIGAECKVQTDYMEKPVYGTVKRIRLEIETEIGKKTLVSVSKIKDIVLCKGGVS